MAGTHVGITGLFMGKCPDMPEADGGKAGKAFFKMRRLAAAVVVAIAGLPRFSVADTVKAPASLDVPMGVN